MPRGGPSLGVVVNGHGVVGRGDGHGLPDARDEGRVASHAVVDGVELGRLYEVLACHPVELGRVRVVVVEAPVVLVGAVLRAIDVSLVDVLEASVVGEVDDLLRGRRGRRGLEVEVEAVEALRHGEVARELVAVPEFLLLEADEARAWAAKGSRTVSHFREALSGSLLRVSPQSLSGCLHTREVSRELCTQLGAPPRGDHLSSRSLLKRVDACFCLLYTSPSPRDRQKSRMPSSA